MPAIRKKKTTFFSPYFVDMDFVANAKKLIAETHENDFEVKYYPVSDNCKVPTKSTAVPAGYELYAAEKCFS